MTLSITIPSVRENPALYSALCLGLTGAVMWIAALRCSPSLVHAFGDRGANLVGSVGFVCTVMFGGEALWRFIDAQHRSP